MHLHADDKRLSSFFAQRIAVAIQLGNYASNLGLTQV